MSEYFGGQQFGEYDDSSGTLRAIRAIIRGGKVVPSKIAIGSKVMFTKIKGGKVVWP
jgi:hypothetical protein